MNDRQMKAVVAITESGSFSKAAEALFLSKQALIKQIDMLEQELGFPIFQRSQRGVSTTEAGSEFYTGVKQLLKLGESIAERSRRVSESRQVIRIANPLHPKLMLGPALSEFLRRFPDIQQKVVFMQGSQVVDSVLSGSVDAGECVLNPSVLRPELSYTRISTLRYMCVMAGSHPLAVRSELSLEDLSGSIIGVSSKNQQELISAIKDKCSDTVLLEQDSDEIPSIFNICFNSGIYITKAFYAAEMDPLISIPLSSEYCRESVLVYRRNPGPAVKKLVKLINELYI